MKVDKHGYKITGIRKVAGESKCLHPYSGNYLQVNYDKVTGHLWTNFHANDNSWSVYHDKDVVWVANLKRQHTMQEIADRVAERMNFEERYCE